MGEAIAVDGSGSPPSTQIIFSAIGKENEGDCTLPPEEGEYLEDAAAECPGEPLPLYTNQTFTTLSYLRWPLKPPFVPLQGLKTPHFASKTSQNIA